MPQLIRSATTAVASPPVQTEYDLHGIVGLRLVDPGPEDIAAISWLLGPPTGRLRREPDLVVRFVDRLDPGGRVRRLAPSGAGFTDDSFVLVGGRRARPRVRIPLAQIGAGPCELVCERGLPGGVPLLKPIMNLIALGNGWVPLHASAFSFNGVGAIAAGWAGGGKTGTLLAFMAAGARYVSDDWVYVGGDGSEMRGLPAPLEVRGEYLDRLPQFRLRLESALSPSQRIRNRALRIARRVEQAVHPSSGPATGTWRSGRLRAALRRRSRAAARPEALFGREACALTGRFDRVFLMLTHDAPEVRLTLADPVDVARRLVFSLEHEWQELLFYYWQFRFASPEAANQVLEERETRQSQGVARALSGKPAYVVSHPSPAPVGELFQTLAPLFEA